MKTIVKGLAVAAVLATGLVTWYWWQSDPALSQRGIWLAPAQGQARIEGKRLYDIYCASCHGLELQGQFNWRQRLPDGRLPAPPHDVSGHTWHHPDSQLVDMIKYGFVGGVNAPIGYQSDMPAFQTVLNDAQIALILRYIKSHWDERSLSAQKEITRNAR